MSRDFARQLRRNMTEAERLLWHHLRHRQLDGCRFRRQSPIGPYIVDFVCFERRLVIELDGGQHARQTEEDTLRTAWLNSRGYRVLRFWNHWVFEDVEVILEAIWNAMRSPMADPPPRPSPARGEGGRSASVRYPSLKTRPSAHPKGDNR